MGYQREKDSMLYCWFNIVAFFFLEYTSIITVPNITGVSTVFNCKQFAGCSIKNRKKSNMAWILSMQIKNMVRKNSNAGYGLI